MIALIAVWLALAAINAVAENGDMAYKFPMRYNLWRWRLVADIYDGELQ